MRRVKLFFSINIAVLSVMLQIMLVYPVFASPPLIAPDHTVQIEKKEKYEEKPGWQKIWDMARKNARDSNYNSAKSQYLDLFEIKPNIVEARWEYAKLLTLLGDYKEASEILESLLELEPENLEFLLAAGTTALENSRYSQAVKYFGQVYESNPVGKEAETALPGLIKAFTFLGKQESAFLMLELVHQRNPQTNEILKPLARLSRKLGFIEKARFYYSRVVAFFPTAKDFIFEAAEVNDYPEYRKKASYFWEKYLLLDDNYLPFHQKLADYFLDNDQPELALPHLIKLYKNDFLSNDLAFEIANLYYLKLKRPDKALLYYEQYALSGHAINEVDRIIESIRNQLALEYLSIVENNASRILWDDLDLITLNKRLLFLKIAGLLEQQQKNTYEIEILEILYEDKEEDLDIAFRLSQLYKKTQKYEKAYSIYELLENNKYTNKNYLSDKAEIEIDRGQIRKSLTTYNKYLSYYPENTAIIQRSLNISGMSGLVEELIAFWKQIPDKVAKKPEYIELQLVFIESLRKNGLFSYADEIYVEIFSNLTKEQLEETRVFFHLAETLLQQNLLFEAEQIIRQIVAKNIDVEISLEKLFHLAIREKQFSRARLWLSVLKERINQNGKLDGDGFVEQYKISKLEIDLLLAEQEYGGAEDLLNAIAEKSLSNTSDSEIVEEIDLYRARILYKRENYEKCLTVLNSFKNKKRGNLEVAVLNDLITVAEDNQSFTHLQRKVRSGNLLFFDLLSMSQIYLNFGSPQRALNSVNLALNILPDSIVAQLYKIQIKSELSQYADAIEITGNLTQQFPEQEYFERLQLELEFKRGNFKEVVAKVRKDGDIPSPENVAPVVERIVEKEPTIETKGSEVISDNIPREQGKEQIESEDLYFWKKLLLARSLWAENRREEAINVYDSLLSSPVDSMFLEKVEVEKINFHLPPLKKSFWNVITFTSPSEPDPITTVMDPKFVANNIGQPVDDIAASMYGKYRWQKLIRKELAARRATEERDYYRAEKEYLSLLKDEKSEETIFDLATIYNKLGLYGKEAELYELMKKKGPLYPGLDEYISANVLKRQPRISSTFYSSSRDGRDGYINIKEKSFGVEGWLMPTYDQEISFKLFHNQFGSYDDAPDIYSNSVIGSYSTYYEDILDLNISAGINMPSDGRTNEVLLKFELIGRLSDSVEAYGRFEQNIVDDTIYSVTESITYRDLESGLKYDLFPRWFLGGDYRYRIYSDDNQQNRYKLWTMYHLFGEMNQFKIKYSYEHITNTDQNVGNVPSLARDPNQVDRLYWSPDLYWQHMFTMHFRHLFEGSNGPDSPISYWSVDYSLGLEDESNVNHELDLNIFLEINRHFLLKGNILNINGSDYEETTAGVSLIYRW